MEPALFVSILALVAVIYREARQFARDREQDDYRTGEEARNAATEQRAQEAHALALASASAEFVVAGCTFEWTGTRGWLKPEVINAGGAAARNVTPHVELPNEDYGALIAARFASVAPGETVVIPFPLDIPKIQGLQFGPDGTPIGLPAWVLSMYYVDHRGSRVQRVAPHFEEPSIPDPGTPTSSEPAPGVRVPPSATF